MHRTHNLSFIKSLKLCSIPRAGFSSLALRNYHFDLLNLKIGLTKKVEFHPASEKLYVSQVELHQLSTSKQICSGLREYLPRESLQNRLVVVVDNMKKCKLRGEVSEGMLLCGEDTISDKVSLCSVADFDSDLVGKSVVLKSDNQPTEERTTRKIKPKEWEDISSRLQVGENGQIIYRDENGTDETYLCVYNNEGEPVPVIAQGLPIGSAVK